MCPPTPPPVAVLGDKFTSGRAPQALVVPIHEPRAFYLLRRETGGGLVRWTGRALPRSMRIKLILLGFQIVLG